MENKVSFLDRKVWYKRIWSQIVDSVSGKSANGGSRARALAIALATLMFILLILSAEYKVFEALYAATNKDFFLTASALLVTGVSAVVAEILHGNPAATEDQEWWTSNLFISNLIVGAILGLAAYLKAGQSTFSVFGYSLDFGSLTNVAYLLIVGMTAAEIFIYRYYFNEDVERKYQQRKAKIGSKRREAELENEEAVAELEAEVERKSKKILVLETAKKKIRTNLLADYGGNVPPEVMARAMREIDALASSDKDTDGKADSNSSRRDNHRPTPPNYPSDGRRPAPVTSGNSLVPEAAPVRDFSAERPTATRLVDQNRLQQGERKSVFEPVAPSRVRLAPVRPEDKQDDGGFPIKPLQLS